MRFEAFSDFSSDIRDFTGDVAFKWHMFQDNRRHRQAVATFSRDSRKRDRRTQKAIEELEAFTRDFRQRLEESVSFTALRELALQGERDAQAAIEENQRHSVPANDR